MGSHTGSSSLFYLQRQADKFTSWRAAVSLFLKGWLTTKQASRGNSLLVSDVVSGQDGLLKGALEKIFNETTFQTSSICLSFPSATHPAICSFLLLLFSTTPTFSHKLSRSALTRLGVNYCLGCKNPPPPTAGFFSFLLRFFYIYPGFTLVN